MLQYIFHLFHLIFYQIGPKHLSIILTKNKPYLYLNVHKYNYNLCLMLNQTNLKLLHNHLNHNKPDLFANTLLYNSYQDLLLKKNFIIIIYKF